MFSTPSESPKLGNLKSLTILEIVDRTFRIYRENFVSFFAMALLVTGPLSVLSGIFSAWQDQRSEALGLNQTSTRLRSAPIASTTELNAYLGQLFLFGAIILLLTVILSIVQTVLVNGTLTYMTSERNLGRRVSIGQAFAAIRGRLGVLAAGMILYFVIILGLLILVGFSAFVFFLCGFSLGFLIFASTALQSFLTPVLVLENVSVSDGLSRAWSLAKARFWKIFGLTFAIGLIAFVLSLAFGGLIGVFTAANPASASTVGNAALIILNTLVSAFVAPVLPIALTLTYYDARIQLEGLDIALSNVTSAEPRPADVFSPPPTGGVLIKDDLMNIAILTVGMIVIGLVFFALAGASINALVPGTLR